MERIAALPCGFAHAVPRAVKTAAEAMKPAFEAVRAAPSARRQRRRRARHRRALSPAHRSAAGDLVGFPLEHPAFEPCQAMMLTGSIGRRASPARMRSCYRTDLTGPNGSPGLECAGKTGSPS